MLRSRLSIVLASLTATVAAIGAFSTNVETLQTRANAYLEERSYLGTLQHPYPVVLERKQISDWSSGQVQLALFQIDGYRGALKSAPTWIKLCLTSPGMFPGVTKNQFNERVEIPESFVDQQNKEILQQRLNQIDNEQREDRDALSINDPFLKLLTRSRNQLLSRYKDSEIPQLDKSELYLLRNAIFARHGYPFNTAKLAKFAHRMGWSRLAAAYQPNRINAIERCNAFFLQQLNPSQELGALGRGVLIRDATTADSLYVKPAICSCLAKREKHVDCQRGPGASNAADFHDTVDLIVEIEQGPTNRIEWTYLDEKDVAVSDLDNFRQHEERFYSSALDFNVAVQSAFESSGQTVETSSAVKRGAFWGARLALSPDALAVLARTPALSSSVARNVCESVHRALETAGPFIPRTIAPVPLRPDPSNPLLEVRQKPIAFDDLRIKLTKDYIRQHYDVPLTEIEFVPNMLVIHRSRTQTMTEFFDRVRRPILRAMQDDEEVDGAAEVNESVHYLVDRDGSIYSLMKDFEIARHSIGLDRHAIGITIVGADAEPASDEQIVAMAMLVRHLKTKYRSLDWLLGDADTTAFEKSSFWEEMLPFSRDPAADPGKAYMTKLRSFVADLNLKASP